VIDELAPLFLSSPQRSTTAILLIELSGCVSAATILFYYLSGPEPGSSGQTQANLSRASLGPAATGSASEDLTSAALANGGEMAAWVSGATLTTGVPIDNNTTFQTVGQYTVGPSAQHVIAADFNGDGNADLAVSNFGNQDDDSGGNLQIFLGHGDGTFTQGATANAGATPVSMAAADFNGDGKMDLAVVNVTQDNISVLLGNGDGTFQAPVTVPVPEPMNCPAAGLCRPGSLVAADFNGDGRMDIAIGMSGGGAVAVLLGNGNGSFKPAVSYPAGIGNMNYLAWMDLNGDGNLDLIVANPDPNGFSFLFGNGDGSFQAPVEYVAGADPGYFALLPTTNGALLVTSDEISGQQVLTRISPTGVAAAPQVYALPPSPGIYPIGIAAADLNGDRLPDIVTADGFISVQLRDPSGGFNAPVNYNLQSGSQAVAVALADLNADGHNDVVAAGSMQGSAGTVEVVLGKGDGTLGQQHSYAIGGYPGGEFAFASGIVIGDFNRDGKPDVAAGFQTPSNSSPGGGISVLLGNGDGTLGSAIDYAAGGLPVLGMATGDFNGDGKLDIAAGVGGLFYTNAPPGALAILLGAGDGTFQNAALTQVGSPAGTPIAIAAADLNGDGKTDLVASVWDVTQTNKTIVVLLGNGDGTFRQLAPITTGAGGQAIAVTDLDGDGIPDLVVGDCCGVSESVYLLGKGDGTFGSPSYFSSGSSISAFAVADWNGDGTAGLAMAQNGGIGLPGAVMAMESGLRFPGPATLISPAQGGTNVSLTATLTWAAAARATSYGVYLGTSPSPPFFANVTGTSYTPAGLLPNTTYYWTVVSDNAAGSGGFAAGSFTTVAAEHPSFFNGEAALSGTVYYLQFPDGNLFGYYSYVANTIFYHYDMGYEAFIPGSAADIYLYDFTSSHWWYTSSTLFPYLFDFTLNSWIYYFSNTADPGHYTTNPRYFSNLTAGKIFTM
jgi:hypothetical protein